MSKIKPRERDAIVQSLRAGIVPKLGLQHIQVGRVDEIKELIKDLTRIVGGGAAIRFIIGEYGSGKTFLLKLISLVALERGLVVASADLAPDRRIHAKGGQAKSLYAEMMRNVSTSTKPNGGALTSVVERFVARARKEAENERKKVDDVIKTRLDCLEELTGGYDFAEVIRQYWRGNEEGNDELKSAALRWLRAEFATKTDARKALGVRTIINDSNVYDHLKIMAIFVREAGYNGLVVSLDEMVNIYKLSSSQARNKNYEEILRILNDSLQGTASHIGFLMGGTPQFLMDTRRGLYSYEALQSRLAENTFANDGLVDNSGPVISLENLSQENLYVLLQNIRRVMEFEERFPDEAIEAFLNHCLSRIGATYFRTPRSSVKAFVDLLSLLEQYPKKKWTDLIKKVKFEKETGDDMGDVSEDTGSTSDDDKLTSVKIGKKAK